MFRDRVIVNEKCTLTNGINSITSSRQRRLLIKFKKILINSKNGVNKFVGCVPYLQNHINQKDILLSSKILFDGYSRNAGKAYCGRACNLEAHAYAADLPDEPVRYGRG